MKSIVSIILVVILAGCSDDPVSPPVITVQQHTANGWLHFETAEYEDAKIDFKSALILDPDYTDASNGVAWSLMMQDSLQTAEIVLNSIVSASYHNADTYSALAFLQNAEGNYASSNTSIDSVRSIDSDWSFSHISDLDFSELNITEAHNYISLGDFINALSSFRLIEDTFMADVNTPEGREALLNAIEVYNPGIAEVQTKAKR